MKVHLTVIHLRTIKPCTFTPKIKYSTGPSAAKACAVKAPSPAKAETEGSRRGTHVCTQLPSFLFCYVMLLDAATNYYINTENKIRNIDM